MRLWDVATRHQIGIPLTARTRQLNSEAFSPDGKTLATGNWDGSVRLWDVVTGHQIGYLLTAGTGPVESLAFSPDGRTLATGSYGDGTAQLWDVATQHQIGIPLTVDTEPIRSVAFSPDGKTLATGGDDGAVRLWNVAYLAGDIVAHVCALAGQSLTHAEWTH